MIFQSDDFVIDDVGNCLLFLHSKKAVTQADFEHVLQLYRRLGAKLATYRCLAITDGAGPTTQQRQQQQREFGDVSSNVPTAVVSDAITVRFVVSSLCLFLRNIKAFEPRSFPNALEFVGFAPEAQAPVLDQLRGIGEKVPPGRFKTFDAILNR